MQKIPQIQIENNIQHVQKVSSKFFQIFLIVIGVALVSLAIRYSMDSIFVLKKSNQLDVKKTSENIINRSFKVNECYSIVSIVKSESLNGNEIEFDGGLIKKRQTEINLETNLTKEIYENKSTIFIQVLEKGLENVDFDKYNSSLIDDANDMIDSSNISSYENETNNETDNQTDDDLSEHFEDFFAKISNVFRIVVERNGKIKQIQFPMEMDTKVIALIRTLTTFYFPTLQNKLNMSKNMIGSQYESNNSFAFETDDEETTFSEKQITPTLNTNSKQSKQSKYIFYNNGSLKQSKISSLANFKGSTSDQDEGAIVIDSNFQLSETLQVKVGREFSAQSIRVKDFQSFLQGYSRKNETITLPWDKILKYIQEKAGSSQDEESSQFQGNITILDPNSTEHQNNNLFGRRLLQDDGRIINSSVTEVFTANPFGFVIKLEDFTEVQLIIKKDTFDSQTKSVNVLIKSGNILQIGNEYHKITLLEYESDYESLGLEYTKIFIQSFLTLYKSNFLLKVASISKSISNISFFDRIENRTNVLVDEVEEFERVFKAYEQTKLPNQTLSNIKPIIERIKTSIGSRTNTSIEQKKVFIQRLCESLQSYHDTTLASVLSFFDDSKVQINSIKQNVNTFLNSAQSFGSTQLSEIKVQIDNLIPLDALLQRASQKQKVKGMNELFEVTKRRGFVYIEFIRNCISGHNQNLINFLTKIIDLYFENQNRLFDGLYRNASGGYMNFTDGFRMIEAYKNQVNITNIQNRTLNLLKSVVVQKDFFKELEKYESKNISINILAGIENNHIWNIRAESIQCCWRKKKSWQIKKRCYKWNQRYGPQINVPYQYPTFRQSLQKQIFGIVSVFKQNNEMLKLKDVDVQNKTLPEIFKIFEQKVSVFNTSTQGLFDKAVSLVNAQYQKIKDIVDKGCGKRVNLDSYLSLLQNQIQKKLISEQSKYENYINNVLKVVKQFKPEIYKSIKQNTMLTSKSIQFNKTHSNSFKQFYLLVNQLKNVSQNYDPEQFSQSPNISVKVNDFYQKIKLKLTGLCSNVSIDKDKILDIRKEYESMYAKVKDLNDTFLGEQLVKLKQFLNTSASSMFSSWLEIPFCQLKTEFETSLNSLYLDFNNFTIIWNLYQKMKNISNDAEIQLVQAENVLNSTTQAFDRKFTHDGFKGLLIAVDDMGQKLKIVNDNISLQLAQLRQQSSQVLMFLMTSKQNLTKVLNTFPNTPYFLVSKYMFENLTLLTFNALNEIRTLNYDSATFITASQDVQDYYDNNLAKFQEGINIVSSLFNALADKFSGLNSSTNQETLNELSSNIDKYILDFNKTLFPNTLKQKDEIKNKYKSYVFQRNQTREYFNNSMNKLDTLFSKFESKKISMYVQMKGYFDNLTNLLRGIDVGSLNSLYNLTNYVNRTFSQFLMASEVQTNRLNLFWEAVTRDFRELLNFRVFYKSIENTTSLAYQRIVKDIKGNIQVAEGQLASNSRFLINFKAFNAYSNMQSAKTNLTIDFVAIWSQISNDLNLMDQQLSGLSSSLTKELTEINSVKSLINGLRDRVTQRVLKIQNLQYSIHRKIFQIIEINFVDVIEDSKQIILNVQLISKELNLIIGEFGFVQNLTEAKLNEKNAEMNKSILSIKQLLEEMKKDMDQKSQIKKNLSKITLEVQKFMDDLLVQKMQKLKQGQILLKSLNVQGTVVKNKTIISNRGKTLNKVFHKDWPLLTSIAMIMTKIQITVSSKSQFSIDLNEYNQIVLLKQNNVDVKMNYYMSIVMNSRKVYEFIIYGQISKSRLNESLHLMKIIPMNVVKPIIQLNETKNESIVKFENKIDLLIQESNFVKQQRWRKFEKYQKCFATCRKKYKWNIQSFNTHQSHVDKRPIKSTELKTQFWDYLKKK